MQPAIRDRLCRVLRKVVIAGHDVATANHQLANLIHRQDVVLIVPNNDFNSGYGPTDAAEPVRSRNVQGDDGRCLRLAIALKYRNAKTLLEGLCDSTGQRLATGD